VGGLGGTGCTDGEAFPRSDLRQLSRGSLRPVRNLIYEEAGLCFKTATARARLDNSDCFADDPADMKLNRFGRANIEAVRGLERQKGCRN
jgi:hypothetical protein